MPALVNHKGKRVAKGGGPWNSTVTYEYKSPGVNFPNENKKNEELAALSSGVTIIQLSDSEINSYLENRKIGRFATLKKEIKL